MRNALLIGLLMSLSVLNGQVPVTAVYNLDSLSPQFKSVIIKVELATIDSSRTTRDTTWTEIGIVKKYYTADGRCIKASRKEERLNIDWQQEVHYDAKSRTQTLIRDDAYHFTEVVVFDEQGRKSKSYRMLEDFPKDTSKHFYTYDENGRLAREDFYLSDKQSRCKWVYEYDPHGQLSRKTFWRGVIQEDTWWIDSDSVYYYDGQNRLIGTASHRYSREEPYRTDSLSFEYDTAGRRTKEVRSSSISGSRTTEYTYDSLERVTTLKVIHANKEIVISIEQFRYDEQGYVSMRMLSYSTNVEEWLAVYNQQDYPVRSLQRYDGKLYRHTWTYRKR